MLVYEITSSGLEYLKYLESVVDPNQVVPSKETLRYCLLGTLSEEYLVLGRPTDYHQRRIIRGLRKLEKEGLVVRQPYFTADTLFPGSEDLGKYISGGEMETAFELDYN